MHCNDHLHVHYRQHGFNCEAVVIEVLCELPCLGLQVLYVVFTDVFQLCVINFHLCRILYIP